MQASGKTLGIVGMGRIGRAVAQRARGFDMPVLYTDQPALPPELEHGAEFVADRCASCCRAATSLSLHAPGGAATDS